MKQVYKMGFQLGFKYFTVSPRFKSISAAFDLFSVHNYHSQHHPGLEGFCINYKGHLIYNRTS